MQIVRMWADINNGTTDALEAFIARAPAKVVSQFEDTMEEVEDGEAVAEDMDAIALENGSSNAEAGPERGPRARPAARQVDEDGWEVVSSKKHLQKK